MVYHDMGWGTCSQMCFRGVHTKSRKCHVKAFLANQLQPRAHGVCTYVSHDLLKILSSLATVHYSYSYVLSVITRHHQGTGGLKMQPAAMTSCLHKSDVRGFVLKQSILTASNGDTYMAVLRQLNQCQQLHAISFEHTALQTTCQLCLTVTPKPTAL